MGKSIANVIDKLNIDNLKLNNSHLSLVIGHWLTDFS